LSARAYGTIAIVPYDTRNIAGSDGNPPVLGGAPNGEVSVGFNVFTSIIDTIYTPLLLILPIPLLQSVEKVL
jgi:hypothetical protein